MVNKSLNISKWLDTHTLFSINGMCSEVGINTSNFMKYKSINKIPEKYIPQIEEILKEYGYINL